MELNWEYLRTKQHLQGGRPPFHPPAKISPRDIWFMGRDLPEDEQEWFRLGHILSFDGLTRITFNVNEMQTDIPVWFKESCRILLYVWSGQGQVIYLQAQVFYLIAADGYCNLCVTFD